MLTAPGKQGNDNCRAFIQYQPLYCVISKYQPASGPLHLPFSLPGTLSLQIIAFFPSLTTTCKATRLPGPKPRTCHLPACFLFSRAPVTHHRSGFTFTCLVAYCLSPTPPTQGPGEQGLVFFKVSRTVIFICHVNTE